MTGPGYGSYCSPMAMKNGESICRRCSELRPEFVPLGFLVEEPAHGYEVYRRFRDSLAGLWRISESQMYATLKRLEERGLVEVVAGASAGGGAGRDEPRRGRGAAKRLLRPSDAGRSAFADWLEGPTACSPRILRLEFLTRLFFARRLAPDSVAGLAVAQRASVADGLQRLSATRRSRGGGFDPVDLALAFSESQLRSALEWIDSSVAPTISC